MELKIEEFKENKGKLLAVSIFFGLVCIVLSFVFSKQYAWILRGTGFVMLAVCLGLGIKNATRKKNK